MADVKQKNEVDAILSSYAGSPIFGSLRYYVDNTAYSYDGALVESEVDSVCSFVVLAPIIEL